MIARALLTLFILMFTINIGLLVHTDLNNNILEKVVLVASGIAYLQTRKLDVTRAVALGVLLLVTFACALGTSFSEFSFDRYFRSALSLGAVFLLLVIDPDPEDRIFVPYLLAWLPVASLVLGAAYQVIGINPLFATDFLGASRLQGSSIPAGLGTYGYIGTIAATIVATNPGKRRYLLLAGGNLVVLGLSGARMPLGLTLVVTGYIFAARILRKPFLILAGSLVASGLIAVLVSFFGESLLKRFESNSLSGRELLWATLQGVLDNYPDFGIGLGHQILVVPPMVTKLTLTIAAHNEYLRLAVELGYAGCIAVYLLLASIIIRICTQLTREHRIVFLLMCLSFFVYCATDNAISSSATPLILVLASFSCARRPVHAMALRPEFLKKGPRRFPRHWPLDEPAQSRP